MCKIPFAQPPTKTGDLELYRFRAYSCLILRFEASKRVQIRWCLKCKGARVGEVGEGAFRVLVLVWPSLRDVRAAGHF